MWVIPVGVVGISVFYAADAGVAAVWGDAVFDGVSERLSCKATLGALR